MSGIMMMLVGAVPVTPVDYYWSWFNRGPSNNPNLGPTGFVADASGNLYYNTNLIIGVNGATFSFGSVNIGTYAQRYSAYTYEVNGTNIATYFALAKYNSSNNSITFSANTLSGVVRMSSITTQNPPNVNWYRQYVLNVGSSHLGLGYSEPVSHWTFDLDSSGNIYGAGTGSAPGAPCCADYVNAFIWKLNPTGSSSQWVYGTTTGTSNSPVRFDASATSASGNTYAAGGYEPVTGGWLVKFNSSGTLQWRKYWQGISSQPSALCSVALDSSENVYVCFLNSSYNAIYLIKFDSSGTFQWCRKYTNGTNLYVDPQSLALDASGNVYVFARSNNGQLPVLKYDTNGTLQWQRRLSTPGTCSAPAYYFTAGSILISGGAINLATDGVSSSTYGFKTLFKFPLDGSKTGTYSLNGTTYTYAAGTGTDTAQTVTVGNAFHGFSSGTNTITSESFTAGTTSFTQTKSLI